MTDHENRPDVSVNLAGVRLRSPIGVGSIGTPLVNLMQLTPELHAGLLLKHVEAGAGYICLPSMMCVPEEMLDALEEKAKPVEYSREMPSPRFLRIETEGYGLEGLYFALSPASSPRGSARFFGATREMVRTLREKKPADVPIIASVAGLGAFPETLVAGARAFEELGVDLIEINISCGLSASVEGAVESFFEGDFPLYFAGSLVGDQPHLAGAMTRAVVGAVGTPVGVKLSAETGFPAIVGLATTVRDAGARFINCSNGAISIVPPDIYRGGKPKWPFMDGNPFIAASGNWQRMLTYKQVGAIAKFVPGIDIIATGGIVTPEHVVEAMMLGASATEAVAAVLYNGRRFIRQANRFLGDYLQGQGYNSATEIIGLGTQYIRPINQTDFAVGKAIAEVDADKCIACGLCADHVCLAIQIDGGIKRVDAGKCIGCGMCVALCPQGAVRLRMREE